MNFESSFDKLLGNEGGYTHNPADPGGATNWGITQAVARQFGYTGDMRDLHKDQARAIYEAAYWAPIRADELPDDLRFHVFDAAVNSGVGQAVRWLQRATGAEADGIIGPQTMRAVNCLPAHAIVCRMNGHRLLFMAGLKTWPVFGAGWARRIANNMMED